MKLENILVGLKKLKVKGNIDIEINGIENNSTKVKPGFIFVAIKGFDDDGHNYINDAIKKGAVAIMIEQGCDLNCIKEIDDSITIILAQDTREALAILSSNFYDNPSKKLKLIGITGTKGKTTTAHMIKEILEKSGKKVGLIGTIYTYINGKKYSDSSITTPESIELQKIFSKMVEQEVEYVVMEVSSQSLKLNRVCGCDFDIVIFTNLSEDHISEKEHPDMQDYFASKLKLFSMCKIGITNVDDLYGAKLPSLFPKNEITTYGIDNSCNINAKDVTVSSSCVDFKVKINGINERVKVCIPGRYSVYNALAAIAVAEKLHISTEIIKEAFLDIRVPGRAELVDNKLELQIMIDYAHTPESLQSILKTVKTYARGKVICVFGCGGDRDKRKRPTMGEISGRNADYTIITTDNPRKEEPEKIIESIEEGIKKTKGKYEIIVDRKKAIEKAIKIANKLDVIILAGKGHETYQEINGEKYPFDEREIVKNIIEDIEKDKKQKEEKKNKNKKK